MNEPVADASNRPSLLRRWAGPVLSVMLLIGIQIGSYLNASTTVVETHPGSAVPIRITGPEVGERSEGVFRLTTISIRRLTRFEQYIARWRGTDLLDLGPEQIKRLDHEGAVEIENSKHHAWEAANRFLRHSDGPGAELVHVAANSAASAAGLRPGDIITRVGDSEVTDPQQLVEAVKAVAPGTTVTMAVTSGETTRDVEVTVGNRDGGGFLGVLSGIVVTRTDEFVIDSADIGGPSAGLMFTLAMLDRMTDGDLTGGHDLAGTGTIDGTGTVGPIGGIGHKVTAAASAGAKYFFAPVGQAGEAKVAAKGKLTVIEVATVADAVRWLCGHGGVSDPGCVFAGTR